MINDFFRYVMTSSLILCHLLCIQAQNVAQLDPAPPTRSIEGVFVSDTNKFLPDEVKSMLLWPGTKISREQWKPMGMRDVFRIPNQPSRILTMKLQPAESFFTAITVHMVEEAIDEQIIARVFLARVSDDTEVEQNVDRFLESVVGLFGNPIRTSVSRAPIPSFPSAKFVQIQFVWSFEDALVLGRYHPVSAHWEMRRQLRNRPRKSSIQHPIHLENLSAWGEPHRGTRNAKGATSNRWRRRRRKCI